MKALWMIVLFSLALNVSAACPVKRPGALPLMPDGAVATKQEMHRARRAAEKYLLEAEVYIDCKVMNRRQHLALVAQLEDFSQVYDAEVIEFQIRSNIVAEIIADSGFDWILLDSEHSPNEVPDLLSQLQAMSTGTAPSQTFRSMRSLSSAKTY